MQVASTALTQATRIHLDNISNLVPKEGVVIKGYFYPDVMSKAYFKNNTQPMDAGQQCTEDARRKEGWAGGVVKICV